MNRPHPCLQALMSTYTQVLSGMCAMYWLTDVSFATFRFPALTIFTCNFACMYQILIVSTEIYRQYREWIKHVHVHVHVYRQHSETNLECCQHHHHFTCAHVHIHSTCTCIHSKPFFLLLFSLFGRDGMWKSSFVWSICTDVLGTSDNRGLLPFATARRIHCVWVCVYESVHVHVCVNTAYSLLSLLDCWECTCKCTGRLRIKITNLILNEGEIAKKVFLQTTHL